MRDNVVARATCGDWFDGGPATTLQQRIDEEMEEAAPFADSLEQALMACAEPLCPIYNDGDQVGYFRQAAAKLGRQRYALRMETVEPVFGQIKQARGFRQFLLRGLEKVNREWLLICTGHNLLKLFRSAHRATA